MSVFHLAVICVFHLSFSTEPSSFFSISDDLPHKSENFWKRDVRALAPILLEGVGARWGQQWRGAHPDNSFPRWLEACTPKLANSHLLPPSETFWPYCSFSPLTFWWCQPDLGPSMPQPWSAFPAHSVSLFPVQVPHSKGSLHLQKEKIPHSECWGPK